MRCRLPSPEKRAVVSRMASTQSPDSRCKKWLWMEKSHSFFCDEHDLRGNWKRNHQSKSLPAKMTTHGRSPKRRCISKTVSTSLECSLTHSAAPSKMSVKRFVVCSMLCTWVHLMARSAVSSRPATENLQSSMTNSFLRIKNPHQRTVCVEPNTREQLTVPTP